MCDRRHDFQRGTKSGGIGKIFALFVDDKDAQDRGHEKVAGFWSHVATNDREVDNLLVVSERQMKVFEQHEGERKELQGDIEYLEQENWTLKRRLALHERVKEAVGLFHRREVPPLPVEEQEEKETQDKGKGTEAAVAVDHTEEETEEGEEDDEKDEDYVP